MKQQSDLKHLRRLIKERPMSSVEQLAAMAGWQLAYAQKKMSQLVSGGYVVSHPKRYEMAPPDNAKQERDRARLDAFLAKKEKQKNSADSIVNAAIEKRSDLQRAWG